MKKILIVEDKNLNVELLVQLLEDNFKLLIARDGEQGVLLTTQELPDLILMDMSLPGIDGWTATNQIKNNPCLSTIPIICVSAHAMEGDEEKACAAGCDDYLTKPINELLLFEKIETWLGC